ncbi:MAG: hypothetical protein EBE86_020450 [Hormoscilla sp. GUM202]|nr:hypothetical protein [Hormoscilla sp. GUM202]
MLRLLNKSVNCDRLMLNSNLSPVELLLPVRPYFPPVAGSEGLASAAISTKTPTLPVGPRLGK